MKALKEKLIGSGKIPGGKDPTKGLDALQLVANFNSYTLRSPRGREISIAIPKTPNGLIDPYVTGGLVKLTGFLAEITGSKRELKSEEGDVLVQIRGNLRGLAALCTTGRDLDQKIDTIDPILELLDSILDHVPAAVINVHSIGAEVGAEVNQVLAGPVAPDTSYATEIFHIEIPENPSLLNDPVFISCLDEFGSLIFGIISSGRVITEAEKTTLRSMRDCLEKLSALCKSYQQKPVLRQILLELNGKKIIPILGSLNRILQYMA